MPRYNRGVRPITPTQRKVVDGFKPRKFHNYLTISELALFIERDQSWIKRLERDGRIPKAARVQRGKLSIRLWSPAQAEEIRKIIATHRVGRPPKDEL